MDTAVNEVPFIKFPPFPKPPPGVEIISFESFQPAGIQIAIIDDPTDGDYIEHDGLGIPTIFLKVKHVITDDLEKKKKKKRKKGGGGAAAAADGRKLSWWEQWIEAEELRPTIGTYLPSMTANERLVQAAEDFSKSRAWPPSTAPVVGLWNHVCVKFRIYIGVLPDNPQGQKAKQVQEDENADPPSDEEFGQAQASVADPVAESTSAAIGTPLGAFIDDEPSQQDDRMDTFMDDPEKCVKTYLSSHFRERGMIWNELRCRDAPKLIAFFLDYLLRNNALPQSTTPEKALRAAHDVAKLAEKELPATFSISHALPGQLSEALVNCWGSKRATLDVIPIPTVDDGNINPEGADAEPSPQGGTTLEILNEEVAATLGPVTANSTWDAVTDNVDGWDNSGGWGDSGAAGQWGDAGGGGGWGGSSEAATAAAPWASADGWDFHQVSLMELMGPTALPYTHRPGVVEESTRRVIAVFPPVAQASDTSKGIAPDKYVSVEEELLSRFGRMILAPWGEYGDEESEIQQPRTVDKSRGAVKLLKDGKKRVEGAIEGSTVKPHDPLRDSITVLIDPTAVDTLAIGMALGATWVQLVRDDKENANASQKEKDGSYWYLEQLMKVLPSYWIE